MNLTRKVGFHIKSMNELERIASIPNVNLVELKPDKMEKNGASPYIYKNRQFSINESVAKEIQDICQENNVSVQIHLPYESQVDLEKENGLCYGIKEHHSILLDRFEMINELYKNFGIGEVVVLHPPQIRARNERICSKFDGLEHGREFLYLLDKNRIEKDWNYKVGLENMVPPKKDAITLGYTVGQLKLLIGNSQTIGLTVDSGHRLLNDQFSVSEMFSLGVPIVSMHFHRNPGVFSETGFSDDAHQFANSKNLKHFNAYIRSIRRNKIPLICEVRNLSDYSSQHLEDYVGYLRFELD